MLCPCQEPKNRLDMFTAQRYAERSYAKLCRLSALLSVHLSVRDFEDNCHRQSLFCSTPDDT